MRNLEISFKLRESAFQFHIKINDNIYITVNTHLVNPERLNEVHRLLRFRRRQPKFFVIVFILRCLPNFFLQLQKSLLPFGNRNTNLDSRKNGRFKTWNNDKTKLYLHVHASMHNLSKYKKNYFRKNK